MANEINASVSLGATKGGATVTAQGVKSADMAGDQMITNVQIVGTSSETLQLGDIATLGYLMIKNLDGTNYVEVASDTAFGASDIVSKLSAGDICLLKSPTSTLYVKANTASCNIAVTAVEL